MFLLRFASNASNKLLVVLGTGGDASLLWFVPIPPRVAVVEDEAAYGVVVWSEEEKAKGKTVEIGRATFDTPKKRWTIFDAPGHKSYVPNMIMGAALADYGALVISAKKGEFESGFDFDGQTREHV